MRVAYSYGVYDILRANDLEKLDRLIQVSKTSRESSFGLGIYEASLCEALGIDKPLKSLEDRMKIMEQIRGIDFVFSIPSLDNKIVEKRLEDAYELYVENLKNKKDLKNKEYDIGYAPGTYDLFHAGHLENLQIASEQCKTLIVGIKSNELVEEHKKKSPIISDDERMEIMRHFKFVHDVYKYHTRNLFVANDWINSKYGKSIDAVFLGSDLKKDFADVEGINIIYTPRNKEKMKTRSTTAYRKKLGLRILEPGEKYYGKIKEMDNNKSISGERDDRELE